MKLRELLQLIQEITTTHGLSPAWICGGISRDKVLGKLDHIGDLDITTGDASVKYLAKELVAKLNKSYSVVSKTMDDGHTSVFIGNLKVDFSSNFIVPQIDHILADKGITNPTDMQRELYSRDFTCNSLLMTLDLKTIKDPLGTGIQDIKDKILRTCLDPDSTFRHNTNRIIRTVYLAAKLDFEVDEKIIDWISQNREMLINSSPSYIKKQIDKALTYNQEKTLDLLDQLDLWDYIPISESLYPFFVQRSIHKEAQFFRNFDYVDSPTGPGTGLYQNLDKYKSVSEWRKKRRKRRQKTIEKALKTRPK